MRPSYLKKSLQSNSLSNHIVSNHGVNAFMLATLSAHLKVGRDNPIILGFNKPLTNAVFFCQSKTQAAFNRLQFDMAGLFREGASLAVPRFGIVTPVQSCRLCCDKHKQRVISSQSRNTAMSVISILNELKAEVQALRAELAALKAEKSNQNATEAITEIQAAQSVQSIQKSQSKPKQDRILRLPEVLKITGFKRTSFYAKLKQGLFQKIKLGERSVGFFESEIYAFVQSLAVVGGAL